MSPLQNSYSGQEFFVRPNHVDTRYKTIPLKEPGCIPHGNGLRFGRPPTPSEGNIYFPQNQLIGTNLSEVIRVMPPTVQQDTYLDNEVGIATRAVKAKFGKKPFIGAIKRISDRSAKLDKEWEEYWEEEANMRSFFKEGED
jgi:hypothetical protein